MKVYIHIAGFTKALDMPFKPTTGELIYFSWDFRKEFTHDIATIILDNYEIYKDQGRKLLKEDCHDCCVDDYCHEPISFDLWGFDTIECSFWDMDDKTQEVRYNIVIAESKPRDKVCYCSEELYIKLLKNAVGIYE